MPRDNLNFIRRCRGYRRASTMSPAMSTTSSAIKTVLFTLFVPFVVAVWVPQRMIGNGRISLATPILLRAVGGILFLLGVIGYFWCATLFVRAHGTPAPIFPTKKTVVADSIASTATRCTHPFCWWYLARLCSTAANGWQRTESFSSFASIYLSFSTKNGPCVPNSTTSTRNSAGRFRAGYPDLEPKRRSPCRISFACP